MSSKDWGIPLTGVEISSPKNRSSTLSGLNIFLFSYGFLFTRDDVVSQRLKFGSAFLSSSWESGTFSNDDEHVNVNYRKLENEPWCYHACPNEHELVVLSPAKNVWLVDARPRDIAKFKMAAIPASFVYSSGKKINCGLIWAANAYTDIFRIA